MTPNGFTANAVHHGDARQVLPELIAAGGAGQVKLCYLDPPFNTRGAHSARKHYRDHRTSTSWMDLLRVVITNVHSLLRDDGSLWLHLDPNELGSAKLLCEEIFLANNAVGVITWEKTRRPAFLHSQMSSVTDFILVFAKDRTKLPPFTEGTTESGKRIPIAHRGNRLATLSFPPGSVRFRISDGTYPAGDHSSPSINARLLENVVVEEGRNQSWLRMTLPSRYSEAKLAKMVAEGADFLIPKVPFRPSYIAPAGKPKLVSNLWSWQLEQIETNEDAARQQERLFPGRPFASAKPEGLLRRIISLASEPGDIVLDCFAGSGTTSAVAQALGRKWIAVEERLENVESYLLPRMKAETRPFESPAKVFDPFGSTPLN